MSIINGLLTGGILIGKICQTLSSPNSKTYTDESGVTVTGAVSSGGVKFFRSNEDGTSQVYAFNTDTKSAATITIPNEGDANGLVYIVAPTGKVAIGAVDSPLVSPRVNVTTGLTADTLHQTREKDSVKSLLKLAFSGVKIGKEVLVGDFRISCNTTQLIVIATALTSTALTYMFLRSDKGVSASSQNRISSASPVDPKAVAGEQRFNIDFASLGIDMKVDTIEGQITLELYTTISDLEKISAAPSRELHPAEKEFFKLLELGKL